MNNFPDFKPELQIFFEENKEFLEKDISNIAEYSAELVKNIKPGAITNAYSKPPFRKIVQKCIQEVYNLLKTKPIPSETPAQVTKPKKEKKAVVPIKREIPTSFIMKSPEFTVISFEEELELYKQVISEIIKTYDFETGKRMIKKDNPRNPDEEKKIAEEVPDQLYSALSELIPKVREFIDETEGGCVKISETEIKRTYKKPPKSKTNMNPVKKPDEAFPDNDLYLKVRELTLKLSKLFSKEFISKDQSILDCGILYSRSIISSSIFKFASWERIGILKELNLNVCETIPIFDYVETQTDLQDYYWLLINAKAGKKGLSKPSDIFARRIGITHHLRFDELNIVERWNEARENVSKLSDPVGSRWNDILNSAFMYHIIVSGIKMNPFFEPVFNEFINSPESIKLYSNELFPISFFFTPFHAMCPKATFEETQNTIKDFYTYENFSWVSKSLDPTVDCVIDRFK